MKADPETLREVRRRLEEEGLDQQFDRCVPCARTWRALLAVVDEMLTEAAD